MTNEYQNLSDSEWEVMSIFFDNQRKRTLSLREVVDGIFYILKTGCQWRYLPSTYPKWTAIYYYFDKWSKDGTTEKVNQGMNEIDRLRSGRNALPSLLCADSQSVKLSPMIFEQRGIDGNKKVNGRKRQVLVDSNGRVWAVTAHAANISDTEGGLPLLKQIVHLKNSIKKILTDNGYKGKFASATKELDIAFEVSSRPPTSKGFVPLKCRWVVERTFAWTNFFRRLVKDYEHSIQNSATWVFWMNIYILKNRIST